MQTTRRRMSRAAQGAGKSFAAVRRSQAPNPRTESRCSRRACPALDHDGRPPRQLCAQPPGSVGRAHLSALIPLSLRLPHRRRLSRGPGSGVRNQWAGDSRHAAARCPCRLRDYRCAAHGESAVGHTCCVDQRQQQPVLLCRGRTRPDGGAGSRDGRSHRTDGSARDPY